MIRASGCAPWRRPRLTPAGDPDHWDLIEGQGSLFHASYAGVTLALIHGAQPDALVMCHEPTRTHMRGLPTYKLPDLKLCIERNVEAARLTNPAVSCVGVAVNTAALDAAAAPSAKAGRVSWCGRSISAWISPAASTTG